MTTQKLGREMAQELFPTLWHHSATDFSHSTGKLLIVLSQLVSFIQKAEQ